MHLTVYFPDLRLAAEIKTNGTQLNHIRYLGKGNTLPSHFLTFRQSSPTINIHSLASRGGWVLFNGSKKEDEVVASGIPDLPYPSPSFWRGALLVDLKLGPLAPARGAPRESRLIFEEISVIS